MLGDPASMKPLPTRNSQLAWRRADFRSVPEMLDYAARGATGITFYNVRGEILSTLPWRDLQGRAQVLARRMIDDGVAARERVVLTALMWPGFFALLFEAQRGDCAFCLQHAAQSPSWASMTSRVSWAMRR